MGGWETRAPTVPSRRHEGAALPGERILMGAAALPEPDRHWLAAAERLSIESIWQGGHLLPRHPTGEAITRLAQALATQIIPFVRYKKK